MDSIGDNGPATAAQIRPGAVCFDTCGNVIMADQGCRVRAIVPSLPVGKHLCGLYLYDTTHSSSGSGIAGVAAGGGIQLYPNPNSGAFTVTMPAASQGPACVEVTDMMGRKIKEQAFPAAGQYIQIEISSPPGVYFVHVTAGDERWSGRVVVSR